MIVTTIDYTVFTSPENKRYVYFEIYHTAVLPWWLGKRETSFTTIHNVTFDKIDTVKQNLRTMLRHGPYENTSFIGYIKARYLYDNKF